MITIPPEEINNHCKPGYIGFTFHDGNIFSEGVALFTKDEHAHIDVSHTFIVVDHEHLIEASFLGVRYKSIADYIYDPNTLLFFKKPNHLDSLKTTIILEYARSKVGYHYDFSLILGFIGRYIRQYTDNVKLLSKYPSIFDTRDELICSELVAESLNEVIDYKSLFPLNTWHTSKISPNMLFNSEIFKEWEFV